MYTDNCYWLELNNILVRSDPLASLLETEKLSRPQVVKRIWDYIKSKNLQNPEDKREIICDDRMKTIFGVDRIGMFKMNKQLGEYVILPLILCQRGDRYSPSCNSAICMMPLLLDDNSVFRDITGIMLQPAFIFNAFSPYTLNLSYNRSHRPFTFFFALCQ